MVNEKNSERPILEVKNICKRFGGVEALKGASFNLKKGEVLSILGDNGAGKSTLVKTLAGVHQPDGGKIYLNGTPVKINDVNTARNLGIEIVYQDLGLVPNMDAPYNLFLGRTPKKWIFFADRKKMIEKTRDLLKKLRISTIQDLLVPVESMSGGQRQALAISRAVAFENKIVILDEPTAALGVTETAEVLKLIKDLKNQGTSVIVITHNLEHVFMVSDRVLVLRNGKSVAQMECSEIDVDKTVKLITTGTL
ncbi:ATP-binding cassette domain-containing protein [Bacillus sp. Marseille-P3661]|uniref:ATP-binding cassette domain-containing protein n=1 Tax=Bacillus sp. Marseille-P3661 TaxID=1936234 RepID=UPI000C826D04|nr:ATP-binding cassette domain-containing protein [Bacillus sp. Marseille-P3661]